MTHSLWNICFLQNQAWTIWLFNIELHRIFWTKSITRWIQKNCPKQHIVEILRSGIGFRDEMFSQQKVHFPRLLSLHWKHTNMWGKCIRNIFYICCLILRHWTQIDAKDSDWFLVIWAKTAVKHFVIIGGESCAFKKD